MTREATARFRLSFDSSAFTFATRNSWGWGGGEGGLLLAPGRLSVGQGVGWGGGAERRVTRPFVNNLVKVANYSGYSSLRRCLSKALLESGKKLTGRLPVTLMLAYNVPITLFPTATPATLPRDLDADSRENGGGGKGNPVQKTSTIFLFRWRGIVGKELTRLMPTDEKVSKHLKGNFHLFIRSSFFRFWRRKISFKRHKKRVAKFHV